MDKRRRTKYLIAIYLLVTVASVVLLLVALNYASNPVWQSIWINLATGLLGVTALFFLVDRFFLSDEWSLSDRIEQLIRQLELRDRPSAQEFFVKQPDLAVYISTAKSIRMCGLTLTTTINRQFGHLRQRLAQGVGVDILIADPNSLALEMSALRSEQPDDIDYYSRRLESTFKDIGYLFDSYNRVDPALPSEVDGPLSVRLLSYAPSFALYRFEGQDGAKRLIVELYTHGKGYLTPAIFELMPERDQHWYDYFSQQIDDMWERSTPWVPPSTSTAMNISTEGGRHRLAPAFQFLTRQRHFPSQYLEDARTIFLSGYTLSRTIRDYVRSLEHCLSNGGDVRVMLLDSDESLLAECVKRSHGRSTSDHWRKRLESTVSLVEVIAHVQETTGYLHLGRLPYLPSFGLIMVDPDSKHGRILVEIYHHHSAEDNPTFELHADRDREWYAFFRQQYELMWGSCCVELLTGTRDA